MTDSTSDIYVWAWLPGASDPVPAGVLTPTIDGMQFSYGRRYLERENRISLSPTLPLQPEPFDPTGSMAVPSAIRDAAPDAWGRRVILNRVAGSRGQDAETADLPERTYLMQSDSNRIGALDFQASPAEYVPRGSNATLPDMQQVAELISAGEPLPPALHDALLSGTGIGGARPKALTTNEGVPSLVKFSVSTDVFPAVEAEALASNLAVRAGLSSPLVHAVQINGRYALISDRFDREPNGSRRAVVSALTLTGRDELGSRYSSYPELVEKLTAYSLRPEEVGPELFDRIAFNMMISNNDDHLRNHAAFWDGKHLELTPAYDLAPSARREGAEQTQTLPYGNQGEKVSNLAELSGHAHLYGLTPAKAVERIDRMRDVIERELSDAAEEMQIPAGTLSFVRSSFLHETTVRGLRAVTGSRALPAAPARTELHAQSRRGEHGLGRTPAGGNQGSYAASRRNPAAPPQ